MLLSHHKKTIGLLLGFAVACGDATVTEKTQSSQQVTQSGVTTSLRIDNDWGAGYCASVTLANEGSNPVTDWTVEMNSDGSVVNNLWSGSHSSSGDTLTVTPAGYNSFIDVGAETSFGFCADGSGRPTITSVSIVGGGGSDSDDADGDTSTGGTDSDDTGGDTNTGGTDSDDTGGDTNSGGSTSTGGTGGTSGSGICSATYEAEGGSVQTTTGGELSSGDGWNIWSEGSIYTDHDFVAGNNTVTVVAKGDQFEGAPHMVVSVGGQQIGSVDVPATSWTPYEFDYDASSTGSREIRVAFTNDLYQSGGGDRNLHVDSLSVQCDDGTGSGGGTSTGGTGGGTSTGGTTSTGGSGGTDDCAEADATICTNEIGSHCGYTYELWRDSGGGCMTLESGGNFSISWGDDNNILARKGVRPGTRGEIVTYDADYTADGTSFMGVYGWTQDPLIEYYIVDAWGGQRPGEGGEHLGTVVSDGGTYDIYRTQRVDKPSIEGTATFYQYWSVRTSQRSSGTITVGNHFSAWENAGLSLGSLYEVSFVVEGFHSTGSADVRMSMQ